VTSGEFATDTFCEREEEVALRLAQGDPSRVLALIIFLLFCAALALLQRLRNHPLASPERLRKALHLLTGTTAFAFPVLFDSTGPVWALVAAILVLLVARRRNPVTGGVARARASVGELCMPIAIATLFELTRGQAQVLYALPLFFLVFADSFAALVGSQFGSHRYGSKSIEGTVTFFTVALLAGLAVLPPGSAIVLAFAAMGLEHISWRGLDNLTVPLGSYFVLVLVI